MQDKKIQSWSIPERSAGIRAIYKHLVSKRGLTRDQAIGLISSRTGAAANTVSGWCPVTDIEVVDRRGNPKGRKPPDWRVIQILRYELGMEKPADIIADYLRKTRSGKAA